MAFVLANQSVQVTYFHQQTTLCTFLSLRLLFGPGGSGEWRAGEQTDFFGLSFLTPVMADVPSSTR